MISPEYINLGIVGAALLLLVVYLVRFVLRYKHQYESNPLCTTAVLFCLTIVILATFLLPVDLYAVSIVKNQTTAAFNDWATNETRQTIDKGVFAAYYSLYGIISILIFVFIPFLHFFNEENESNSSDRLHHAIKYTFGIALVAAVFFILGFAIPMSKSDPSSIINKIAEIINTNSVQQALTLVLSILTIAGLANVSFYTASGLFCLPIGLLMGKTSVSSSLSRLNDREVALRVKVNNLQEKDRITRLTPAEKDELNDAITELRDLERNEVVLTGYRDTVEYKLRKFVRPFQIIVGMIFCLFSIFLLVTLILVNVDRILHSGGPKQGYIISKSTLFNPLEFVLQKIHNYVVIGPLPLLIIMCYLVVATISGIRNLGLWFIIARVHRIRVGRTQPQALLYFCVTIMLTVLSFNAFLFSMSSDYITFGDQYYKDSTGVIERCNLENYDQSCVLTRSFVLTMRMISQIWFVGAVMYWINWVFVAVASVSFLACLIRGKRKATHGIVTDEDDFED